MLEEFLEDRFSRTLETAKKIVSSNKYDNVKIVHHNDADGLCAAAILYKTFSHINIEPKMFCIERFHPAVTKKVHAEGNSLIIYTDLGAMVGDIIKETDNERNLVLILDHHPAREVQGKKIMAINPELAGISGDMFISASTICYLFSRYYLDTEIEGTASLSVIGSVGDYHDRSGGVLGYDRYILELAARNNEAKIKIMGGKEKYFMTKFNEYADVIADCLTTLGSVGYYNGDFKLGLDTALNGVTDKVINRVEELKKLRRKKFEKTIKKLKDNGLRKERYVQWFHVGRSFMPMGVKVIGLFCHTIKDMSFIDEDKFVAGFQEFVPELPGIGRIDWEGAKVSFRAPAPLERKVLSGKVPGLDVTLPIATDRVGGIADASHRIAAASLVKKNTEEKLIQEWEAVTDELSQN